MIHPRAALLLALLLARSAVAGPDEPPPDFTGTWKLDRNASDPMHEMLKAQGYSSVEVGILAKLPVTQIMTQSPSGMEIAIRSTVIKTQEQLRFDGVSYPDKSNVLGPLVRASRWSPDGRYLLTVIRYSAKCGLSAEMTVSRTISSPERKQMIQDTKVRLGDGREFKARQVFVRLDSGSKG